MVVVKGPACGDTVYSDQFERNEAFAEDVGCWDDGTHCKYTWYGYTDWRNIGGVMVEANPQQIGPSNTFYSWTPLEAGTYTIYCKDISEGADSCTGFPGCTAGEVCAGPDAYKTVVVSNPVPPGPWWQVKDGDVTTNGDLDSSVPTGLYFDMVGDGGYPGIAKYGGATNLSPMKVSSKDC